MGLLKAIGHIFSAAEEVTGTVHNTVRSTRRKVNHLSSSKVTLISPEIKDAVHNLATAGKVTLLRKVEEKTSKVSTK